MDPVSQSTRRKCHHYHKAYDPLYPPDPPPPDPNTTTRQPTPEPEYNTVPIYSSPTSMTISDRLGALSKPCSSDQEQGSDGVAELGLGTSTHGYVSAECHTFAYGCIRLTLHNTFTPEGLKWIGDALTSGLADSADRLTSGDWLFTYQGTWRHQDTAFLHSRRSMSPSQFEPDTESLDGSAL